MNIVYVQFPQVLIHISPITKNLFPILVFNPLIFIHIHYSYFQATGTKVIDFGDIDMAIWPSCALKTLLTVHVAFITQKIVISLCMFQFSSGKGREVSLSMQISLPVVYFIAQIFIRNSSVA